MLAPLLLVAGCSGADIPADDDEDTTMPQPPPFEHPDPGPPWQWDLAGWLQALAEHLELEDEVEPALYSGDTSAAAVGAVSAVQPLAGRGPYVVTDVAVIDAAAGSNARATLQRNQTQLCDGPTPFFVLSGAFLAPVVLEGNEALTLNVAPNADGPAGTALRLSTRGSHVPPELAAAVREWGEAGWTGQAMSAAALSPVIRTSRTMHDANLVVVNTFGALPTTDIELQQDGRRVMQLPPELIAQDLDTFVDQRRVRATRWEVTRSQNYALQFRDPAGAGAGFQWVGFAGRRPPTGQ